MICNDEDFNVRLRTWADELKKLITSNTQAVWFHSTYFKSELLEKTSVTLIDYIVRSAFESMSWCDWLGLNTRPDALFGNDWHFKRNIHHPLNLGTKSVNFFDVFIPEYPNESLGSSTQQLHHHHRDTIEWILSLDNKEQMPATLPAIGKKVNWTLHQALNPKWSPIAARLVWLFDALLSTAILWKIKCIFHSYNIDSRYRDRLESLHGTSRADPRRWTRLCSNQRRNRTSMVHLHRKYHWLDSYPAGHVWIYTALYKITSRGKDIFSAQVVFLLLYLTTLAITLSLYRTAKVSPFCYYLHRSLPISFPYYVCQNDYIVFTSSVSSTIAGLNCFSWSHAGYSSSDNGQ